MHRMFFRNVGGVHQLQIADDEDLARIDHVDPARWAATSAPLKDLACDPAFLAFLDSGNTGRLRVSQLVAARDWLFERLRNRARIRDRTDTLSIADIEVKADAGQKLKKAIEHVLGQLKPAEADRLTLKQLRDFRATYVKSLLNGDGIVCAEHVSEPAVATLVKDIIATIGSSKDASGLLGVSDAELTKFLERGKAFLDWKSKPVTSPAILAWGEETQAAGEIVRGLDTKVEEFFLQCDLLRQQDALAASPRLSADEMRALKAKDAAALEAYLAALPLATPNPEGVLSLEGPINVVYQDRMTALRTKVVGRALGSDVRSLTRASWRQLKATFEALYAWQRDKPIEPFDKLAEPVLAGYLQGPLAGKLKTLIDLDKAAAGELEQLVVLEKFMLYQRWLLDLVNNFVNLSAIYHPSHDALMERGSLVIDGRRLDFCLKVEGREAHKKVAAESLLFLVYASVTEKDTPGGATFEVVAPLTSGERGRLRVGKRGIFIDNDRKEWDAVIVDLAENPISLREGFKAPFRRMADFIHKKIESLAETHLKMAETTATDHASSTVVGGAAQVAAPVAPAAAPAAAAPPGQGLQNIVLIGGLVMTGLTAALGYVISIIQNLPFFRTIFGITAVVLLIGGLSSFLSWLKLRRRDMSLILEANGWALNVPMKVTRRVGGLFAHVPRLPRGAKIQRIPVGGGARARQIILAVLVGLIVAGVYTTRWLRKDKGRNFDRVVDYARDRYNDVERKVRFVEKRVESIFGDVAPVQSIDLAGEGALFYPTADATSRLLYVPHSKKIEVIDMDEDEKVAEIKIREAKDPVDARSLAIVDTPDGRKGFVASQSGKRLVVFSLDTFRAEAEIPTGNSPAFVLPLGAPVNEVWCMNDGSVTCVSLEAIAGPPKTIEVGTTLRFAAELNGKVYVTAPEKSQVAVIDPVSHSVVSWLDLAPGLNPRGLDVDRVHGLIFVACKKNSKLVVLSAATGKVVHTWDVGAEADVVAFDAGKVFVACDGQVFTADVIDETKFGKVKPIETAPGGKHLAIDSRTHKLYVTAPERTPAQAAAYAAQLRRGDARPVSAAGASGGIPAVPTVAPKPTPPPYNGPWVQVRNPWVGTDAN